MARKAKNDYFSLLGDQVAYCAEAAALLTGILATYNADKLSQNREKMHAIENKADALHHDILSRLSKDSGTPIDQEDILHLVQIIDDITDGLDEAVQQCYMYHIKALPLQAASLSSAAVRCIDALYAAVREMPNFKKPDPLRSLLVEVNRIESAADDIYVEAVHQLFAQPVDTPTMLGVKAVYDSLEDICDQCEHAADVIEQIIIKNN
jgi:uncharacterized protein Yka (UPF0111/DUF47 family)